MVDRLPSLNLLLELVQSERDKQLAHFDALDNKAGIVLAFSGLTRLTVLDTLEDFVNESSVLLREKGRRLGWALRALTVAAAFFAAGIVVNAVQG